MLSVSNLICSRNEQRLFAKISFELLPGQMLQITGKNGSGKSTLLKTIVGLLKSDAGNIQPQHDDMCYIGHNNNLHAALTVKQNLNYLHSLHAVAGLSTINDVQRGLEYFSLQDKAAVKCSELSAGQLQRVSLSRLCWVQKRVWLLDEPIANLDIAGIDALRLLCEKHLFEGGIIVLATHAALALNGQTTTLCLSTE